MPDIPGYEIGDKVLEDKKLTVFRARKIADRQPVLIHTAHHSTGNILLENGYEIARHINSERVVRPLALIPHNQRNVLILEDFNAGPLSRFSGKPDNMTDLVRLFLKINEALCHVHRADIIHNDINPGNLWINSETGAVKLSGFGLSTGKNLRSGPLTGSRFDVYTMEYMSPEQTGRPHIHVTQATDFYSLGCTLYRLATGRLPFCCRDNLELIHFHLARDPDLPHLVNPGIPKPLSRVIMKLLEKNPSNRYSSCESLGKDLEACLAMIEGNRSSLAFVPGMHDRSSGLVFTRTLYGRQKEINRIRQALLAGSKENVPLILVSGAAGVGKSMLVKQALDRMEQKAYVVTGKHDRLSGRAAVPAALDSLLLQILGEGKKGIQKWKDRLIKGLGKNAGLVTDLVPLLEFILGKQPPAMELPSFENDIRLNIVLRKFIETIASESVPLILFLDDMQWIEPESIRLIETIASRPIKGFYMICAYRGNETGETHPFVRIVDKMKTHRIPMLEIDLHPLDKTDLFPWIKDLFGQGKQEIASLSDLIFQKTGGNPFFVKLFIEYLHEIKLLYQLPDHSWKWEPRHINALPATDNVGYFIMNKTHHLPPLSFELLKTASCLGFSFSARTLELAFGRSPDEFRQALNPIMDTGLMVLTRGHLRFAHDIIQESEYAMMPDEERLKTHLSAGKKMLKKKSPDETDDHLFHITQHLNAAQSLLSEPEDQLELAALNLNAGLRKMAASLLEAADRYFKAGIAQLPEDTWETNYDLTLALMSHRCEVLYTLGKTDEADQLFTRVQDNAAAPEHLLQIFVARSMHLMHSSRPQEVMDTGITILSELGISLPRQFSRRLFFRELIRVKRQLTGRQIESLLDLPVITDPKDAAIIRILTIVIQSCAFYGNPIMKIALMKALGFILTHGVTPHAAYVFSFYGSVMGHLSYDLQKGLAFGQLAVTLVEKLNAGKQKILTRHLLIMLSINCNGQNRSHIRQLSELLKDSLNSGLYMNMFNLHVMYFFLLFISGVRLGDIEKQMQESRKDILELNQPAWVAYLDLLFQVVRHLMGKRPKKLLLDSPVDVPNPDLIQALKSTHTISTLADCHLFYQMIHYLLKDAETSLFYAQQGAPLFTRFLTLSCQMTHQFFYALALIKCLPRCDAAKRASYRRRIRKHLGFFKKIYKQAPENNPHMFFLLTAETARLNRQNFKALRFYDKAMHSAAENGFLHVEAISCELAGVFFLDTGQPYLARKLILKSIRLYKEWGVLQKGAELEKHFKSLLQDHPLSVQKAHLTSGDKEIDMFSVLKASQAISGEIKPKKLMQRLIRLIIENSGAQKAFLMLHSNRQLKIEAFAQIQPDSAEILQGIGVGKTSELLAGSVAYAAFLSKKSIILENAATSETFRYDPYIVQNRPVSILCNPFTGKKNIQGVLYLENNLMIGAFTQERLRILDILLAQIVISIENSKLYEKLRNEIKKQVRAGRKIQSHQVQLRHMSSQLARAEDMERKSIADDLHDSVTQTLAMSISFLKNETALNREKGRSRLAETITLLEQSLASVRSLTFQLSSPILYDVGLEAALEWLCEDFYKTHKLLTRFVNSNHVCTPLDEATKVTLYRAVRELLMNIVKHANTRHAVLMASVQDARFTLYLEDGGVGFDPDQKPKSQGFGLFSIAERIRALNGSLFIHSEPGKGCRIKIEVPLEKTLSKGHSVLTNRDSS